MSKLVCKKLSVLLIVWLSLLCVLCKDKDKSDGVSNQKEPRGTDSIIYDNTGKENVVLQSITNEDSNSEVAQGSIDTFSLDGWLKPGISQDTLTQHLGEPEEKGEDKYWGGTGTYVQEWHYISNGLKLRMEAEANDGKRMVRSITAESPCTLLTQKSVGIGSDIAHVKSAYSDKIDMESSTPDLLIVGSQYNGIIFTFQDGKVVKIFIGAAAE